MPKSKKKNAPSQKQSQPRTVINKITIGHPPFPPAPRPKLSGKIYGIAGILFALLGLFFLPLLVGIIAVVCGVKAWRAHENKLGSAAVVLGLFMAILGAVQLMVGLAEFGLL